MENAKIALPDRGDPIEYRGKKDALRENAGSKKVEISAVLNAEPAHVRHHLAEKQQPDRRLNGSREKLGRIMT